MDRKKRIELQYLEEARRASSQFPEGEPVPNDPLDFLFDGGRVGRRLISSTKTGTLTRASSGTITSFPSSETSEHVLPEACEFHQRPACVAGASEAGLPIRLSRLLAEDGPAKRRALSRTAGVVAVARV